MYLGKEKPGIMFSGTNDGRDSEPTSRVTELSGSASRESLNQSSLKGSIVMRQKECLLSGFTCADRQNRVRVYTEEPYEWSSSSTGLWGGRRASGAFTRKLTGWGCGGTRKIIGLIELPLPAADAQAL